MALAGDKICSLVRRRIKRRAVQRAAALRAHKNNMHPGQNAAPGGATAQPQRCALTKKTCTSHPLPKITPPFTRRSSMYITFRTQSLVHTPIMHRERVHSQLQLSPLIWVQCRAHLIKGLVKKVYRAFITDTNQIRPFSSVPPYLWYKWGHILIGHLCTMLGKKRKKNLLGSYGQKFGSKMRFRDS
jgi:hypothetical protein